MFLHSELDWETAQSTKGISSLYDSIMQLFSHIHDYLRANNFFRDSVTKSSLIFAKNLLLDNFPEITRKEFKNIFFKFNAIFFLFSNSLWVSKDFIWIYPRDLLDHLKRFSEDYT